MLGGIVNFLKETKQELNNVTWPSREELTQATLMVIVTTFILAAFIGAVDFCLSTIIRILVG
ncbi:MAG: preprotein translocase subunit SecE [Candidatus Omnitrophica bacterium]|nr:preprotein translocase subunit SecE [Candidatus Omnitrophota bacterium]MDD5670224.1 preprotein translocase subunit SecE [Candidatus Omnitrophota bacterium]